MRISAGVGRTVLGVGVSALVTSIGGLISGAGVANTLLARLGRFSDRTTAKRLPPAVAASIAVSVIFHLEVLFGVTSSSDSAYLSIAEYCMLFSFRFE